MGKSRGERRVIFSSSGAIPTIHDLRRPRATTELRLLGNDASGERALVIGEEAIDDVDEVEATKNSAFGAQAGRQRDSEAYAIRGGACKRSVLYLLPNIHSPNCQKLREERERERRERVPKY